MDASVFEVFGASARSGVALTCIDYKAEHDLDPALTEGGTQITGSNGALAWMCRRCHKFVFACVFCGMKHERSKSGHCSDACTKKSSAAKKREGATPSWKR